MTPKTSPWSARHLMIAAGVIALGVGVACSPAAEKPVATKAAETAAAKATTTAAASTPTPAPTPAKVLELTDVWARATPGLPDENSAIYANVKNLHSQADRIVSASVPETIARRVELHTTVREGDSMKMVQVEGYDVAAGGSLKLEPGGNHIMLIGLKSQLKVGDTFTVTLKLKSGATVESKVEVKTPPAGSMPGMAPGATMPGMAPGGTMAPGGSMPGMPSATPSPRSQAIPAEGGSTRAVASIVESC